MIKDKHTSMMVPLVILALVGAIVFVLSVAFPLESLIRSFLDN